MEGPVSWAPSVPVHLPSMDATVNVTYGKSKLLGGTGLGGGEGRESEEFTAGVLSSFSGTVGLSSMAPGCPRSVPCAGAGTASSTVFLRPFYLAVVSNCPSSVLSGPSDAQRTPFLSPVLLGSNFFRV